ncbi:Uncharacterised protein [Moraxella caviae]|nr:Uncharacterised protein [Moraxella caviae]
MSSGLFFMMCGRLDKLPTLRLGRRGKIHHSTSMHSKAATPIAPKVVRQPKYCPKIRPSGKPSTVASAEPVASIPKALVCLPFGATRTTRLAVIDQKTACESATPARAMSSTVKFGANTVKTWLATNSTNKPSSSFLRSMLAVASMAGKDKHATIHAYTVIITPTSCAGMAKLSPMSDNKAMGINSVVLKINADNASAITRKVRMRSAAG